MSGGLGFDERYRCKALTTTTGERCRRRAHPGALVCVKHGAGAPQVKESARRRLEQQRVEAELGKLMADLEAEAGDQANPLDVLTDALNRSDALVRVLGALVGKLDHKAAGSWERPQALYGPNHSGDGTPHTLVRMYVEAIDRAAKLAKLAIDANLDERRARMEEDQAEVMATFIRGVLVELGVWGLPQAPAVVQKHFELMTRAGVIEVEGG